MCQYPRDPDGNLVAAPDIEIELLHPEKSAQVIFLQDRAKVISSEEIMNLENAVKSQLNEACYQWVSMLQKQGYKPVGGWDSKQKNKER